MSRISSLLPLFEFVSGPILTNKEFSQFLEFANKQIVDGFCEVAFNICVALSVDLTESQKNYLKKHQSILEILVDKTASLKQRRETLARNPKLVRSLIAFALPALQWLKK